MSSKTKKRYTVSVDLHERYQGKKYSIGRTGYIITAASAAEARRKAKARAARLLFHENLLTTEILGTELDV